MHNTSVTQWQTLFLAGAFMQAIDVLATAAALQIGVQEANPLQAAALSLWGIAGIWMTKGAVSLLILVPVLLEIHYHGKPSKTLGLLWFNLILMFGIALYHGHHLY